MANEKHVKLLEQSVQAWNQWRKEHPEINPDLSGALLSGADLSGANLSGANLSGANLNGAKLLGADLLNTDLTGADLLNTDLRGANLLNTDLSRARIANTSFGDCDLRDLKGLETIDHLGPSPLSINTLYLSEGAIPESFLKRTGAPDIFIEYVRSLVGKPIDYYSCFISYSSKDHAFAERLYADLQAKGVRCWYATHDMRIGDEIRSRIDESIRLHDKLLLVLSEHSIASRWVQKEVETAFEQEQQRNKLVLFPIKLDDVVMTTSQAWAGDLRRMRHIGDFTQWKDHDHYQKAFNRLLRDLKAEAQKMGP